MARLKKKNLIENEKDVVSLNPRKLVSHFYDKVDVVTAGVVIFIALFLEFLIFLFLGAPRILEYFTINLILTFIFSWFILGFILYVLLYLIKGKSKLKGGEFKKILSALASFRVVSIFSILIVLLIFLIFIPAIFPLLTVLLNNPALLMDGGFLPSLGTLAFIGIFLLVLFGFALIIYYIAMSYHFVKKMYGFKSVLSNILMTIVVWLIMGAIASII